MIDRLNAVGQGFCLANWTNTEIMLQNGVTLMCGSQIPYKIPESEILIDDNALFNPINRKLSRKNMLENLKPESCQFCWNVERFSSSPSQRIVISSSSEQYFDEIKNTNWESNYMPKYLAVSFSSFCNFKCSYCTLESSTKLQDEITEYGPFDSFIYNSIQSAISRNSLPDNNSETNIYLKSFWRLWPTLYKNLHTFKISGGEPLLINDTFTILDYIANHEDPNTNLRLEINTNLGVGEIIIDKLINKLEYLINENKIKEVFINASIDTICKQAEYARFGLNESIFWLNVNTILTRLPKININIIATYTIFSLLNFKGLLNKIYELNTLHNNNLRYLPKAINIITQLAFFPRFLSVRLLLDSQKEQIINVIDELSEDVRNSLTEYEIKNIKLVYDWSISDLTEFDIDMERLRFVSFVDEHDRKRGTNFIETFPELEDFYNTIKNG